MDLGTCDELALDVLVSVFSHSTKLIYYYKTCIFSFGNWVQINSLLGFSRDFCGIRKINVGGVNKSWPVPDDEDDEEPQVGVHCIFPKTT